MRPTYECPENFLESLTMLAATFPEIFNGLFRPIDNAMNMRIKFEVRSVASSWNNLGYPKIGAVPGYAHVSFLPKLLIAFVRKDSVKCCSQI